MSKESQAGATPSCPHSEAVGTRWDDPISKDRQIELQGILDAWALETDHQGRRGPFDKYPGGTLDTWLSGADVYWLAARVRKGAGNGSVRDLHLEGADLSKAHLEGANLFAAHLEGAHLSEAHLEGASLDECHLEASSISNAWLEGAHLSGTHLEEADLSYTHLERANLAGAHLEKAGLGATFLDGADLSYAHLQGADLTGASLDKRSTLLAAQFDRTELDQTVFDGTNLAVVDWAKVNTLGDEEHARHPKAHGAIKQTDEHQLHQYEAAVRANRSLASHLRSQGIAEHGDRFAYRAQILQREVLRRQHRYGQWLFSAFLDAIAGYGYMPVRSLIAYLIAILSFGTAYYSIGQAVGPHLSPLGAFVFSMTSFHGRGFFPGGIALDDPITVLAAFDAFTGLVIEVSFIATFTQRFFAR